MKRASLIVVVLSLIVIFARGHVKAESGRLYGKLYTVDGETFEGWIRWDKNEAYWDDEIDATCDKERMQRRHGREATKYKEKKHTITVLGLKIGEGSIGYDVSGESACQLQFGHIKTLESEGSDEATAILKSGKEVVFTSGSDLGSAMRGIQIVDLKEGDIYFDWDDLKKIDFMQEPKDPDDGNERLYGKVFTRRAGDFTGWIEWDVDEVYSKDDIDGDEGGRTRKIKLDRITTIERASSSSANLVLKDGKELTLSNSNDVNSENRGIVVKSDDFGRLKIEWADFERVEFMPVPKDKLPKYSAYNGGMEIRGTVITDDGTEYTGHVIWDNDEEYTWEFVNGEYKGIAMDIPFSAIASIEKSSSRGAAVTLKSGATYLLKGSNDVDDDNKGIFIILDNGRTEEVDWTEFSKLVLK